MERRAAGFALVAFVACGGDAVQTPAHPPPREVLALAIRVERTKGDTFCPSLEMGLARSGLAIVSDDTQPADAIITCASQMEAENSLVRLNVNGQDRMHFIVRIQVRHAQGNAVDQFIAEYNGYPRDAPDEEAVGKAVVALAYSQRMAAFARMVAKNGHATAVATTAPPVDTASTMPSARDRRDDSDWFAIDTVRCKIPTRVESCNAVRSYLSRHPDGAHVQEANEVLASAQPALEKLQKDEVAWQKSNHHECASRRTSDACVGVEAYEIQFPNGVHADEARRLLKNASRTH